MLSQVLINVAGLQFAAVAETCDHDLTSALQTQAVRHSVADASVSQVDRVLEAIRNTATDAEVICVSAQAGEDAPFPGTFTTASGHKVEVGAGDTASESGDYCVQNSLVSLMQRATIDGQAGNFESVVAGKGAEKSTSGKNSRRRTSKCGGVSNFCKTSVKLSSQNHTDELCGSKRNEEKLKFDLPYMGCKDLAQIDLVCSSDCTMTCAEALKGTQARLINTQKLGEEDLLKNPDQAEGNKFFPTFSDIACCDPGPDGVCKVSMDEKERKQGEAWKTFAEENNEQYSLTDKCTVQMIEDSCNSFTATSSTTTMDESNFGLPCDPSVVACVASATDDASVAACFANANGCAWPDGVPLPVPGGL